MDEKIEIALRGAEFKEFIDNLYEEVREKYGLKKIEVQVLYKLSYKDGSDTPTEISRRFKLNRGHVSQAIEVLMKRGLVVSGRDHLDRRCTHYSLTEEAAPIVEEIRQVHEDLERQALKGLTPEELESYKRITERIFNNMQEIKQRKNRQKNAK